MSPSEADQHEYFRTAIVPQIRNALINHDADLQRKDEFFTEIVTERGNSKVFEFSVKVNGITSSIRGTYESGGTVELVTSPGGTRLYKIEELEKLLIDQIVGEWVASINP